MAAELYVIRLVPLHVGAGGELQIIPEHGFALHCPFEHPYWHAVADGE